MARRKTSVAAAIALFASLSTTRAQPPAGAPGMPDAATLAIHTALTQVLGDEAAKIQGPAVDQSGTAFGGTVQMGLILIRDTTVAQFQQAQQQLQTLKNASPEEQDQLIKTLQGQAEEVNRALDQMNSIMNNGLKGDLGGQNRGNYEGNQRRAEDLDNQGRHAEADALRREADQSMWAAYLKARQAYYKALGSHPLLGVEIPGFFSGQPAFWAALRRGSTRFADDRADMRAKLAQYIDQGIKNLQTQQARVEGMKTWPELAELGNPAFSATQAEAAKVATGYGEGFVDAATATAKAASAQHSADNALSETALSIVQVGSMVIPGIGPIISAGITSIQIYKSGEDYVIALSDQKNAEQGATVTGYQAVIDAQDRAGDAGKKLLVNVAMAPADIPGFVQAVKAGKVLVKKGAAAARAVTGVAEGAKDAPAVGKASEVTGAAAGAGKTATGGTGVPKAVERGAQKARDLGFTKAEVDQMAESAGHINEIDNLKPSVVESARTLTAMGELDTLAAEARAGGVPEAEIQRILNNGKRTATGLTDYARTVRRDLVIAKANKEGRIFIVDKDGIDRFHETWGAGNVKPDNVIVTDAVMLQEIRTKLEFMRNGRQTTWTIEEINVLKKLVGKAGGDPRKMIQFLGDEALLTTLITNEQLEVAEKFLGGPPKPTATPGGTPAGTPASAQAGPNVGQPRKLGASRETNAPVAGTLTNDPGLSNVAKGPRPDLGGLKLEGVTVTGVGSLTDEELSRALRQLSADPSAASAAVREAIEAEAARRALPTVRAVGAAANAGKKTVTGGGLMKEDEKNAAAAMLNDGPPLSITPPVSTSAPPPATAPAPSRTPTGAGNAAPPAAPKPEGLTADDERRAAAAADDPVVEVKGDLGSLEPLSPVIDIKGDSGAATPSPVTEPRTATGTDAAPSDRPASPRVGLRIDDGTIIDRGPLTPSQAAANARQRRATAIVAAAAGRDFTDAELTELRTLIAGNFTVNRTATPSGTGRWYNRGGGVMAFLPAGVDPGPLPPPDPLNPPPGAPGGTTGGPAKPGDSTRKNGLLTGGGSTTTGVTPGGSGQYAPPDGPGISWGESASFEPASDPHTSDPPPVPVAGLLISQLSSPLQYVSGGGSGGDGTEPGIQPLMLHFSTLTVAATSARAEVSWPLLVPRTLQALVARVLMPSPRATAAFFANGALPSVPSWAGNDQSASRPPVTIPSKAQMVLTSLGASQGAAFQLQVINEGPTPITVSGDGVVVQSIKKEAQRELQRELQQLAPRLKNATASRIEGYCLAYGLQPPSPGTLFRIAPQVLQDTFKPASFVLKAADELARGAHLHPDSNPASYFESIKQYAVWTQVERWDVKKFGQVWLEKTKANVLAAKRNWTNEMEATLMGAVPGRWQDIQVILQQAASLSGTGADGRRP